MRSKICEMFGIDAPIFAFSHCRDVVVEASKAGGMGVLGASGFTKEQLEVELDWIDAHIGGKPYGVDVLMPNKYVKVKGFTQDDLDKALPQAHRDYLDGVLKKYGVPELPPGEAAQIRKSMLDEMSMTPDQAEELLEIAFRHPVKLVVSALGTPARHLVDRAHELGIKVGSLVGKMEHAVAQKEAGVDLIVAQGTEAGGHTGTIATMVLTPQIVDLVAPLPVLAAGGIASGRQMAAALALGAEGVWCGTVWLGTAQAETLPEVKQKIYAASSSDAVITRGTTGKTMRAVRSDWSDVWAAPEAPTPLTTPLQLLLTGEARARIDRAHIEPLMSYPAGQVIGQMNGETTVRQVFYDMLSEFGGAVERLAEITGE